jgi:hypothetical protein
MVAIDWENIIARLIESLALLFITVLIPYAIRWLKAQTEVKLLQDVIDRAETLVSNCVDYTSQTFVNALKKEGKFTKEEWNIAFNMSKERVLALMTEEMVATLEKCFGDLNIWIETQIERDVLEQNYYSRLTNEAE